MKYSYRDSNINGLGKYPDHWKIDRLRDHIIINESTLSTKTDLQKFIRYIDITNVDVSGIVDMNNIKSLTFEEAPSRARRIVKKKNTIISSVRTNLQAVAYIDFDDKDLIASTGFFVCKPKFEEIIHPKFLYWILLTDYSKDYFFSLSTGVSYPAIGDYKFGSLNIPIPPIEEQLEISNYIDTISKKIDDIINIKFGVSKIKTINSNNQINVLQEYRKSLIFECVTGKKQIYKGDIGV